MIFWSKGPHTKEEHIKANKERDRRIRAHLLHMSNAEGQNEKASKSSAPIESQNPEEGLDEDVGGQLGRQKQLAKEMVGSSSKQLIKMRARIRHGRKRARARGRALGF